MKKKSKAGQGAGGRKRDGKMRDMKAERALLGGRRRCSRRCRKGGKGSGQGDE